MSFTSGLLKKVAAEPTAPARAITAPFRAGPTILLAFSVASLAAHIGTERPFAFLAAAARVFKPNSLNGAAGI